MDSRGMVPEPSYCTRGSRAPEVPCGGTEPGLHSYMPFMICSSVPAVRPGMG